MSHFLNLAINENGIITDLDLDQEIQALATSPFAFTDVFIYSHGWWTSFTSASAVYNQFAVGVARTLQVLAGQNPSVLPGLGQGFSGLASAMFWPSVLSEDNVSLLNLFDAASFFTMEHRADAVGANAGYAFLRLVIEARQGLPPLRFHLIGHSFGCRVVLSALQALAKDEATMKLVAAEKASFRVALVQAAADTGSLAADGAYPNVLTDFADLRMLITTSTEDKALGTFYPMAQNLAHFFTDAVPALGHAGPTGKLPKPIGQTLVIAPFGPAIPPLPPLVDPLIVADLSPLHKAHAAQFVQDQGGKMPIAGQHSDFFLPEIYDLLARFIGA
jgi:pimeloyl-ACP methyl ester carboxylesterase